MAKKRFYVVASSGYWINTGYRNHGSGRPTTEYLVLDRAYCHRVVWTSKYGSHHNYPRQNGIMWPYLNRRRLMREPAAREVCRRLNAEDAADA